MEAKYICRKICHLVASSYCAFCIARFNRTHKSHVTANRYVELIKWVSVPQMPPNLSYFTWSSTPSVICKCFVCSSLTTCSLSHAVSTHLSFCVLTTSHSAFHFELITRNKFLLSISFSMRLEHQTGASSLGKKKKNFVYGTHSDRRASPFR